MGVERSDPNTPPFEIVKVPPAMSSSASLPSRAFGVFPDTLFKLGQGEIVCISNDGNHEAAIRADGNPHVVVAV